MHQILSIFLKTVLLVNGALTYNILGVFPSPSKSHYIAGGSLMKGLAAAGHNVTVISPFPQSKPLANFRDYEILGVEKTLMNFKFNYFDMDSHGYLSVSSTFHKLGLLSTNFTLNHPRMTAFLADPYEKFDVVIYEIFVHDALLGLGHHFNAPIVGFSPFGASLWTNDLVGTPTPLSYVPHPFLNFSNRMTFIQKMFNILLTIFNRIELELFLLKQQEIYDKRFVGANKPTLNQIRKNVSLVLLNQHFTTNYPQPYVPNMVEVGGIHINRNGPKPLPDDIRTFIDGSNHGVVYFSLGSNIKSHQLPAVKRGDLLRCFGKLKQRVLWKWETPDLPGKPDNVMISKWFPQDDILAHHNVKIFITHGGLLSMSEAVYHGIPILGIPVFGDQYLNMERAKDAGYGLTVAYSNLTEQSMDWALGELLNDISYKNAAKTVSSRYRDQPLQPLDLAIFWVEFVARHNGAPHIKSAGQDLNLLEYHSIDVFGFLVVALGIIFYTLCWLLIKLAHLNKIPAKKYN